MDISKYLTNKDIQLSNDDINIEKLEKDIRKGYVSSEEVENVRKEIQKQSTASYMELEDKYNKLETITAFSGVLELSKQKSTASYLPYFLRYSIGVK